MNPWLERLGLPSLVSAVVSAIVGGGLGYITANSVDRESKIRSARLDQIVRFTSSNDSMLSEVNGFIAAIAYGQDIKPVQDKLRQELNKQITESNNLKPYFSSAGLQSEITSYQQKLVDFSGELRNATDATKMRPWVDKFDKVAVSRRVLTRGLIASVDIKL